MAIKRINPSRNAFDNSNRQSYGYVIKVPKLPDAHKHVVDFIVFNESDNCFYKCVEVTTDDQHYYTWQAVTFGASRAYLIPVGKLTTTDINDATEGWTGKHIVSAIPKTLHELAFGMRRYKGTVHNPIGFTRATGNYVAGVYYYTWVWNDTTDSTEIYLHKQFTGEMTGLTGYEVGTPIEGEVYTCDVDDGTGTPLWDDLTLRNIVACINEFGDRLNTHEADIPHAYEDYSIDQICKILNLIIDEVNPFSIPWQLLLNRQNRLEEEVGAVNLQVDGISEDLRNSRTDLSKWATVEWQNYDPGTNWDPTEAPLIYGTVVQAIDAALNLIKYTDGLHGDLSDLTDIDFASGDSLVTWLNSLYARVGDFDARITRNGEAIDQIWKAIGEVGYVHCESDAVFEEGAVYWMMNETIHRFVEIPSSEYTTGVTTIGEWSASHSGKWAYVFADANTARNLIAANSAAILTNKNNINRNRQELIDIIGENLKYIYIEKLDAVTAGETLYYYDRESEVFDHPFVPFVVVIGKDLAYYQNYWHSPIFTRCTRNEYVEVKETFVQPDTTYYYYKTATDEYLDITDDTSTPVIDMTPGKELAPAYDKYGHVYTLRQTAAIQIRVNNEELARLNMELTNLKNSSNKSIIKLKILTGVQGENEDSDSWNVDGYVELTQPGQYKEFRKYYTRVNDGTVDNPSYRFVELISGSEAEYEAGFKYALTNDEIFKSGKEYYIALGTNSIRYELAIEGTAEEVSAGDADYTIGTAVPPELFYEVRDIDYVVPYYEMTADISFVEGKNYYYIDTDGRFVKGTVVPGEEVDENTWYEYHNPTPRPDEGVYIRKARKTHGGYEELNTNRGLIDRNTRDIEEHRQQCGAFTKWTKKQLKAIENFVLSLTMSTLDVITQERSTLSLLHETVGRLISIHNALERLAGEQTYKVADGVYDSGYDYYRVANLDLTRDTKFVGGKAYYIKADTRVPGSIAVDSYYKASTTWKYEDDRVTKVSTLTDAVNAFAIRFKSSAFGMPDKAVLRTASIMSSRSVPYNYSNVYARLVKFVSSGAGEYTLAVSAEPVTVSTSDSSTIYNFKFAYLPGYEDYQLEEGVEYRITFYATPTGGTSLEMPICYSRIPGDIGNCYYNYDADVDRRPVISVTWDEHGCDMPIDPTDSKGIYYEQVGTAGNYVKSSDPILIKGKAYFLKEAGSVFIRDEDVIIGNAIPDDTYYEPDVFSDVMTPGVDYEIGQPVAPNVYTKDLVIATTENYTINEIRLAVNRVLNYHVSNKELPEYTALPDTSRILSTMIYYRYIDETWESIDPDYDDPNMIGKRIKDYDPEHVWYIRTGNPVPDGTGATKYTETPIRMFLNELIKLHRRGTASGGASDFGGAMGMVASLVSPMSLETTFSSLA